MFPVCFCRKKNPLQDIFDLHVLSLEVLREAMYPFNSYFIIIASHKFADYAKIEGHACCTTFEFINVFMD